MADSWSENAPRLKLALNVINEAKALGFASKLCLMSDFVARNPTRIEGHELVPKRVFSPAVPSSPTYRSSQSKTAESKSTYFYWHRN